MAPYTRTIAPAGLLGLPTIELADACVLTLLDLISLFFVISFRLRLRPCFRLQFRLCRGFSHPSYYHLCLYSSP